MEPLDLARHEPEAFEGKSVRVDGRTYRIGERFREGSQGYAHELINEQSGLTLLAIQIRPSYRSNPLVALQASKSKEVATADLRKKMSASDPSVAIPIVRCVEGHGGSFELHELGFPWSGQLPAGEAIAEAGALHQAGHHSDATSGLRHVLEQHPRHTVALHLLASCESAAGRHHEAASAIEKAIEIEPNLACYRGEQMRVAFRSARPRAGIDAYDDLRARYPFVHDHDADAVQGLLKCGEPERALQVLNGGGVQGDMLVQLQGAVEGSREGRRRAEVLVAPVREAVRHARSMDDREMLDR